MGKAKNNKKAPGASRFDPYKRETTRITDLCNMLSAATASTLREDNVMEMEQDEAKAEHRSGDSASEGEHNNEEGKVETRGKILQRHKREWKSLRSKLHDMKAHKKAMGHGTLAKKDAKKDVAKEIKALEEAMRIRHEKELADFDGQNKDTLPASAYCEHNRERSMCKACRKSSFKIVSACRRTSVDHKNHRTAGERKQDRTKDEMKMA